MGAARYLTLEEILVIHQDQIDRYGGTSGLRDLSLLESALFRPQTTFSGEDLYKSVFEKTSVLIHSLILNHPFVDGNKRTAMVSGITFLALNGRELKVDQDELVKAALNIASKTWNTKDLTKWLDDNSIKT